MASQGYVEAMLASVQDASLKKVLGSVFNYVLRDIRFGQGIDEERSVNMGGGFYAATTPAVANTEFSIPHGFGRIPYLVIPVLPLSQVGSTIVPLRVERAADAMRVYLSSSATSEPITVYIEG